MHIFHLSFNCSHFPISVITAQAHAIITADYHSFSQGMFVCEDGRPGYRARINFPLRPFTQRAWGVFLEHLPKSDMFDSFSSPLPQVVHTLSAWCWSLSPGEMGEKAKDNCYCGSELEQASMETWSCNILLFEMSPICVCVSECFLYLLHHEYQNTFSTSKVGTFLGHEEILAGPPGGSDLN